MRRTAGYTRTDFKTNSHIAKELEITPVLDKLLEYKRNWIQHVNRMPRDRLPRIMKHYSPTGRRNRGRPLKSLLDTWDRNGSTSGLTPWQTYDDDDDDDDKLFTVCKPRVGSGWFPRASGEGTLIPAVIPLRLLSCATTETDLYRATELRDMWCHRFTQ